MRFYKVAVTRPEDGIPPLWCVLHEYNTRESRGVPYAEGDTIADGIAALTDAGRLPAGVYVTGSVHMKYPWGWQHGGHSTIYTVAADQEDSCEYCGAAVTYGVGPGCAAPTVGGRLLVCNDCYHDECGYGHDTVKERAECEEPIRLL